MAKQIIVDPTQLVIQTEEQYQHILATIAAEKLMPVFGKDELECDSIEGTLKEKARTLVEEGISVIEGTCRANNYRDVAKQLAELQRELPGMIAAIGTNSNILSIHNCVQKGIPMVVAANKMPPLAGAYAVPISQKGEIEGFNQYIQSNVDLIAARLDLNQSEKQALNTNPLTIDPIAYCVARNVVCFPAWFTPGELGELLARGARTLKVFPFSQRSQKDWNGITAALSYDYDVEEIVMMGTGGLKITSEADTVTPCLNTRYFIAAGASDLGKGTPELVAKKARLYVARLRKSGLRN